MDTVMVPLKAWVWLTVSWQSSSLTHRIQGRSSPGLGLWMLGQQVSHKCYRSNQTPTEATSLKAKIVFLISCVLVKLTVEGIYTGLKGRKMIEVILVDRLRRWQLMALS